MSSTPASHARSTQFRVKWHIPDDDLPSVATVLQNTVGPCPLLALANALLLRRTITIPQATTSISEEHLLGCICQAQGAVEFVDVLPRLGREVAVDLCFSGTTDFVSSEELSVFQGLDVRLVHGAIPDPHDTVVFECISPFSYNQVCDQLVSAAASPVTDSSAQSDGPVENFDEVLSSAPLPGASSTPAPAHQAGLDGGAGERGTNRRADRDLSPGTGTVPPHRQAETAAGDGGGDGGGDGKGHHSLAGTSATPPPPLIVQNAPTVQAFLDDHQSCLTYHGLVLLHETLGDGEIAVLFYSSHFSVLHKHAGRLFTLVTDVGYLRAPTIAWESLSDVDGNTSFFDAHFCPVRPAAASPTDGRSAADTARPAAPPHTAQAPAPIPPGGPRANDPRRPFRRGTTKPGKGSSGCLMQ
jgi:hypothetical protein